MAYLIWITGLSGSGKTTLAQAVYGRLKPENNSLVLLDGDVIRDALNEVNQKDYSLSERHRQALEIHNICKWLISQNISVICATISLFKDILAYLAHECL